MDAHSKTELCSIYKNLEKELKNAKVSTLETERKAEIMNLLHDFNDIKDAAQIVIGAVANIDCLTIKELHLKYNLPLNE
uniref:Uncharacterized protein n=1 Tax=Stomoxys calcitrans TaxID=35570 RepID=A0A1I8Q597_STOCA